MKNFKFRYLLIIAALVIAACSDDNDIVITDQPDPLAKKEMRAVWISTAWELDWPMGKHDEASQKQLYIDYLDKCVELNFNTVIVQIRPMGDALYPSSYEPWSASITGTRGQDPGYDVLEFMLDETHKRGLEFHAWMNPYRIATRANKNILYPPLEPGIDSLWVVEHEKIQIYNPAKPEVRDLLTNIVKEVITKYDVDGIHFDDYFYPDPSAAGAMVLDTTDYKPHKDEYATIEDFRRANVDMVIEDVYKAIVETKPGVLFSVSPAASDTYNYGTLYADVNKWCMQGWLDIVMPQLYFATTGTFKERVHWWPQFSFKAVPIIGYGLYKFGDATQGSQFQNPDELNLQFERAALEPKVKGSVMYSAKYLFENKVGIVDRLATIYRDPAVMPFIGRRTEAAPVTPASVAISGTTLSWNSANGLRSVVYLKTADNEKARVIKITSEHSCTISLSGEYFVTTLNKDNVESDVSSSVKY